MSLERAFLIGAAGLAAQRTRMETVSSNLANARTTRTVEGGPYRRLQPVFVAEPLDNRFGSSMRSALRTVHVDSIVEDPSPPILRFEPGHPDANSDGVVAYPNVEPIKEMTDFVSAARSYEANVTVIKGVKEMMRATLEIIV